MLETCKWLKLAQLSEKYTLQPHTCVAVLALNLSMGASSSTEHVKASAKYSFGGAGVKICLKLEEIMYYARESPLLPLKLIV